MGKLATQVDNVEKVLGDDWQVAGYTGRQAPEGFEGSTLIVDIHIGKVDGNKFKTTKPDYRSVNGRIGSLQVNFKEIIKANTPKITIKETQEVDGETIEVDVEVDNPNYDPDLTITEDDIDALVAETVTEHRRNLLVAEKWVHYGDALGLFPLPKAEEDTVKAVADILE